MQGALLEALEKRIDYTEPKWSADNSEFGCLRQD